MPDEELELDKENFDELDNYEVTAVVLLLQTRLTTMRELSVSNAAGKKT